MSTGMGIVRKNAIFCGSETDYGLMEIFFFFFLSVWKRNWGIQKKEEKKKKRKQEEASVLFLPVKHTECVHTQLPPVSIT